MMSNLPADNIYQRLTDLRNQTGKSQKEVANDLDMPASVLSRIERGETKAVSHDLVVKFADYYKVSTDYLLCVSDMRIRKNAELEELGLSNNALLLLLQGKIDGTVLSRLMEHSYFPVLLDTVQAYFSETHNAGFAGRNAIIDLGTTDIRNFIKENPEHRAEGMHDLRRLNAEKITGTEADFEKIKSIFMSMLKDIKKDYAAPPDDISTVELKQQISEMKNQATNLAMKKQHQFDAGDMTQIIMGMLGGLDLDEFEKQKFQELTLHMLQRKR